MATIASLLVNLGMKTVGFEIGAKKGAASLRSLAEGAVALNSAIGIAKEAGAVVGRIFNSFESQSAAIDDAGKLSDRLGLSTENLVALQHAAGLAGVETNTLSNALTKMNVNLGEALQGGEVAKTFKAMGLDAKKLIDISADDALGQIADAINGYSTAAERSAAATAIFGKAGAGLLTVLKDGSKGLRDAREEADRLGITFDRFSALQVEQANDAMMRAKEVVTGLKQQMVIGLAPAIEAAGTTWKYFIENIKQGDILFAYTRAIRSATAEFNNMKPPSAPLKKGETAQKKSPYDEFIDTLAADLKKSATKDQEERNRLFEQGLSPLEQYAKKVDEVRAAFIRLHQANLLNLIDDKKYAEQKARLDRAVAHVHHEERLRRKEIADKQADRFKSIKENLKTRSRSQLMALQEVPKRSAGGGWSAK